MNGQIQDHPKHHSETLSQKESKYKYFGSQNNYYQEHVYGGAYLLSLEKLREKDHNCKASSDYTVISYLKKKQELNQNYNLLMDTKYIKDINYDINNAK